MNRAILFPGRNVQSFQKPYLCIGLSGCVSLRNQQHLFSKLQMRARPPVDALFSFDTIPLLELLSRELHKRSKTEEKLSVWNFICTCALFYMSESAYIAIMTANGLPLSTDFSIYADTESPRNNSLRVDTLLNINSFSYFYVGILQYLWTLVFVPNFVLNENWIWTPKISAHNIVLSSKKKSRKIKNLYFIF